jgi:Na+-driven multidrug efflux pump
VRIESLAFLPLFSIGESAATLAGQETGARNIKEAKRSGIEVAKLNFLAGAITMIIIIVLSSRLPRIFTNNLEVIRLARIYLIIAALTEPLYGAVISLAMAIRGAGNTTVPTIINLTGLYLLRVVPAGILSRRMPTSLCVVGAWISMAIDVVGRTLITVFVYRKYFERIVRRVV